MNNHTGLDGKRILITGAARGVGAETARLLVRRGAKLALLDIREDRLAATAAALGPGAIPITADVASAQDMRQAVGTAIERLGGLDVAVANAGIIDVEPLPEITAEAFRRAVDVNVLGVWHTIRESLPALEASDGYILVVASLVAAVPLPYTATYDASKAAVAAFANAIRSELQIERSGVDLGVAYFSMIDTDFSRDAERSSRFFSVADFSHGPIFKLLTPQRVARALVRAIARRSRRVVVPWYYRPIQTVPGIGQGFGGKYFRFISWRKARRSARQGAEGTPRAPRLPG